MIDRELAIRVRSELQDLGFRVSLLTQLRGGTSEFVVAVDFDADSDAGSAKIVEAPAFRTVVERAAEWGVEVRILPGGSRYGVVLA